MSKVLIRELADSFSLSQEAMFEVLNQLNVPVSNRDSFNDATIEDESLPLVYEVLRPFEEGSATDKKAVSVAINHLVGKMLLTSEKKTLMEGKAIPYREDDCDAYDIVRIPRQFLEVLSYGDYVLLVNDIESAPFEKCVCLRVYESWSLGEIGLDPAVAHYMGLEGNRRDEQVVLIPVPQDAESYALHYFGISHYTSASEKVTRYLAKRFENDMRGLPWKWFDGWFRKKMPNGRVRLPARIEEMEFTNNFIPSEYCEPKSNHSLLRVDVQPLTLWLGNEPVEFGVFFISMETGILYAAQRHDLVSNGPVACIFLSWPIFDVEMVALQLNGMACVPKESDFANALNDLANELYRLRRFTDAELLLQSAAIRGHEGAQLKLAMKHFHDNGTESDYVDIEL